MCSSDLAGRVGFSRNSNGYLASRLRLTRFSGDAVSPQFTMNTDNDSTEEGWYLDDIRVYTCGDGPMPTSPPTVTGSATVGKVLAADPGAWSSADATTEVQWYAGSRPIAGATGSTYTVRSGDVGKRIKIEVTASADGQQVSTFSAATSRVVGG